MIRAAFRNNNVDTCARVCHSPTGYGLKQTFGTSAGTQNFKSVEKADVMLVIGANPTDGHPVFASRMKKRLREGAKLIVADPRRIDMVRTPHIQASHHLQLRPGTNVALMNSLAHVIVTEGLAKDDYVAERCDTAEFARWKAFICEARNSPEAMEAHTGVPAAEVRAAARLYAKGPNAAIYYGLGVTEHSQGSTMVMAMANLSMITGNIGREGVGVNPLRGQNNVQGACDMGSFPHELSGYRHVGDPAVRELFKDAWGVTIEPEPGLRIPNMFAAAIDGSFKGLFVQGEDIAQSDPNTKHVQAALEAMECVVVQDLFLNETAAFAHVFFPGTSFLEKDGTFTNAERRINRVRPVMKEKSGLSEWEAVARLSAAMGYPMHWNSAAEIMDEIARLTPTFKGVSFKRLDEAGSLQWPVTDAAPDGTPTMHIGKFVRGQRQVRGHGLCAHGRTLDADVPAAADNRPDLVAVQCRRADAAHGERDLASRGHAGNPPARRRGAGHRRGRPGVAWEPHRRHDTVRDSDRPRAARRGLHHLPPPRDRRQRDHHGVFRLGHQLPGIQGHRRAGDAVEPAQPMAGGVRQTAHHALPGRGGIAGSVGRVEFFTRPDATNTTPSGRLRRLSQRHRQRPSHDQQVGRDGALSRSRHGARPTMSSPAPTST